MILVTEWLFNKSSSDLRSSPKSAKSCKICNKKMDLFSNGHNSATIGSIVEILDVLSSPNRVASILGTFVR